MYKEVPKWADSAGLKKAYAIAEKHNWSKDELDLYDYWKKREWSHLHAVDEVHKEGKAEGETSKAKEIALSMLKDNMDETKISEFTGLSLEEIEKIKGS